MAGDSKKAVYAALVANAGIAVLKFTAFGFTRSSSMLAEGVHSVADTGNQALLLLGRRLSEREQTESHPFGYGRERYFWAFVVSIVLFALGSLFAIYESIKKFQDPHEIASPAWAFGVLIGALVIEALSLRLAVREANKMRLGTSWTEFVRHSKDPDIAVVLLEDLGALVGLVIALAGVTLAVLVDPVWDAVGSLLIGVLLGVIAVVLMAEMKSLLIGEAASSTDRDAIVRALVTGPDVERVIHMRTMHIGPDEVLVGAKIHLRDGLTVPEVAAAVNQAETAVRDAVPAVDLIYVEPDVYLPDETEAS